MFKHLLSLIVAFLGVKIFLFTGDRNELVSVRECKVVSINDHWIVFNFYEKKQTNIIVRGPWLFKNEYTYYVIEAVFSDGFKPEYKNYNGVKYYIDFKSHTWYNRDLVFNILLDKFIVFLENELRDVDAT